MSKIVRVYPAYIKGEPSEVLEIDKAFHDIWAKLRCSRTDAINEIFQEGLKVVAEREDLGHSTKRAIEIYEKWRQVNLELAEKAKIEFIYEHSTLDGFREWCQKVGINDAEFLNDYMINLPSAGAKSKIIGDWIEYALADGKEHSVDDIRSEAMMEGVVSDDGDWNLMKNIASQKGYSGNAKRGYWKRVRVS